jgi:hypothetical protein
VAAPSPEEESGGWRDWFGWGRDEQPQNTPDAQPQPEPQAPPPEQQ